MTNFDQNYQPQDPNKNVKEPDKKPKKDYFIYIVFSAIILIIVLVVIFFLSLHQKNEEAAKQAAARQSTVQIKKLPDTTEDSDRNAITVEDAQSNVKSAFNFSFKVIAQVKSVSGSSMDLTQLSDSDAKTLTRLFTTSQVLQDFNDIVNLSNDQGENTYGDAGTKTTKVKTPKVGNRYQVKKTSFKLNSDNSDNYVFSVNLKYQPKGFKQQNVNLIVSVAKSSGKLTQIEQKV